MHVDHALKMQIDHASCFTFYILGEAATLEILKSCSVDVFALQKGLCVLLLWLGLKKLLVVVHSTHGGGN